MCLSLMLLACSRKEDTLAMGQERLKAGDYPGAAIYLRNAVQSTPDDVNARLALADALEKTNDNPGAENNLRKALELGGDENAIAPRIAALMLSANDNSKLVNEFSTRRLQDPVADSDLRASVAMAFLAQRNLPAAAGQLVNARSTPAVQVARSQLLLADGRRQEALAEVSELAAAPNAGWPVLRATSRLAALNGKPDLALSTIQRAHEAAPWNNALMGEYAETLLDRGKADEAKAIHTKLKKAAPGYFWSQYLDARFFAREGRVDDTLTAALRVLKSVPDHLPATVLASAAEMNRGDVQSAYKRLQNILAKYPNALDALALMAEAQQKLGLYKEAGETLRKGLMAAPGNPNLLSLRADAELKQNQLAAASATLSQLLKMNPDNASTLMRLAEVKAAMRDKPAAEQLLFKSAELASRDAATYDRVVATALRMNNVPAARKLADAAVAAMPNEPQLRLSLAAVQAAQKDNDGAWKSVLAALDMKPRFQPALEALGAMARKPPQHQELLNRYENAIDPGPAEPATYLQFADWLRRSGQKVKLTPLAALEKGVAAQPASLALRRALVDEYMRGGVQDKALSTAQSAAASPAAPDEAQILLASTYQRVGQVEAASGVYRKLSAANPKRPDWRLKVAQLEAELGRSAEAVTVLKSLISGQPDYADAYPLLARLLVDSNAAEALGVARQMAARPALNLPGMVLEGDVLAMSRQPDEALAQYAKAAKAGAVPEALLGGVAVHDSQSKTAAADALLDDALRRFPKHPAVLSVAAQRAQAAGQFARSAEFLKRVVEADPNNGVALNDLAWAQLLAGQPQALENAKKALAVLPDHPVVLDTLGMALKAAGKPEEAAQALQAAVNIAPTNASTRLHLAQALVAAGKKLEAEPVIKAIPADKLNAADRAALEKLKG